MGIEIDAAVAVTIAVKVADVALVCNCVDPPEVVRAPEQQAQSETLCEPRCSRIS